MLQLLKNWLEIIFLEKNQNFFYWENLRPENWHADFLYAYLKDHTQVRGVARHVPRN